MTQSGNLPHSPNAIELLALRDIPKNFLQK